MIYIPKRIKVGYNNRKDTYTGKLAYIIYYDEYGKIHKETSWENWRNKEIEPSEFDNDPIEGFVLNKKVGGYYYHFDARQTYVRVYDPRGFEFEITVPNLLYILEQVNSLRGKGLEGSFVYGWDDKELVLVPCVSEEYKNRIDTARKMYPKQGEYIAQSKMKVGYKYMAKCGEIIYMGKHDYYLYKHVEPYYKKYFFFVLRKSYNNECTWELETRSSINKYVFEQLEETPAIEYPDLLIKMEHCDCYSPIDDSKETYVDMSFDEFKTELCRYCYYKRFISTSLPDLARINKCKQDNHLYQIVQPNHYSSFAASMNIVADNLTIKELFDYLKPKKRLVYLANGNLYKEEYYQ